MVAGAVGVQEWYFIGYVSGCDWRKHATAAKIARSTFVFGENCRFSAQKSVFLLQIYGSFGDWWHKVRAKGAKRGKFLIYVYYWLLTR